MARVLEVWKLWDAAAREKKPDSVYVGNLGGGIGATTDLRRLAGVAALPSSDIIATAASAATQGWQTAMTFAPGPITARKSMMCPVYSSSPKRPAASGTSRTLCQSVT